MLKSKYKGVTIEIELPEECGHEGYIIDCTYRQGKDKTKYLLSMWLRNKSINNGFNLAPQEIDTQYITSSRASITKDICKIVEHASLIGFFEEYIQRYEYEQKCFEVGNQQLETERLNKKTDE